MATGPIDHPSFLTRQAAILTIKSTAGANTVQTGVAGIAFPFDVRLRNAVATVSVAGTSATTGNAAILYVPGTCVQFPPFATTYTATTTATAGTTTLTTNTTTTTIGSVVLGTSTAGVVVISGDMNCRLPAGQSLLFKNGTDTTGAYSLTIEYHLDPATSNWTGNN